jgi:nicotinamide-nucleotide adenylyltransferase
MSTCIFPGKFQPFHNGHMLVVKGMMKSCGRVAIVICDGGGEDQMFSIDKVREMISASLLDEDIVDANIVVVEDCEKDEEWADKVLEVCDRPSGAKVWSGDEEVRGLFEKMGVAVQKVSPVPGIDGAEIREMILNENKAWEKKVPSDVGRLIRVGLADD